MQDHDLDDELGYEPPADPDDQEPVELTNADEANRMMRRLRATEREAGEVNELAATSIAQIHAWRDERLGILGRTAAWCHRSLEGWIRAMHAQTGRQSVTLPAGKVALRKRGSLLELPTIDTQEKADAWAALAAAVDPEVEVVTVKWSPAKKVIGDLELVKPGPRLADEPDADGYYRHQGITAAGEKLEGVVVRVPVHELGYSAKPAAQIEDLEAELDDAVRLG